MYSFLFLYSVVLFLASNFFFFCFQLFFCLVLVLLYFALLNMVKELIHASCRLFTPLVFIKDSKKKIRLTLIMNDTKRKFTQMVRNKPLTVKLYTVSLTNQS